MSVKQIPNPDDAVVQTAMVSPKRDVQRLRQNSAAVAGELKDFLARMKGRSAKERLGVIASSGLFRSSIAAIFFFAILISALTAGPYFWDKMKADDVKKPEIAANGGGGEPAAAAEPTPEEPAADPDVKLGQPADVSVDPTAINRALGTNGTAEPPANPLDGAGDLLDLGDLDGPK
ncbi:MAG: hypothetical protein ACI8UO_006506 [Verrucomicrobiales bacterium]|jgi:hypothetical protein